MLKALQLARLTGATLAIAKLDRLSRNAAFLLTLRDSGVRFIAADMPEANDLKLDRLSRDAAFLLTPRDSGVRFIGPSCPTRMT